MRFLDGLRRHELSLLAAIAVVLLVTAVLDVQHNYWNNPRASAVDLVRQWSMLGLFALGSAVVIISGGIDLSTGSVIAFSGTICASLLLLLAPEAMTRSQPLSTWVTVVAISGTLACGFLIGSLHAWLITRVGLPPFVATLATLVGLRSLARAICETVTRNVLGGASTQIGLFDRQFRYLATSVWIPAVLVLGLSLLLWLMMSRTVIGRHLYALGGNEQAARLSGINTDRLKWLAYCISAMLASLAGILYICEQSVADPQTLGRGYELNAIAAAVVGGCSLQGGIGTVPGTLLGALFLRAVIDGVSKIIKTGADVYEGLIVGVVVVFAVVFTQSEAWLGRRSTLFAGPLGLVTVLNLTLLSGGLMALIGVRLLGDRVQMDAAWLSLFTMLVVATVLLSCRWTLTPAARRRFGVVLGVVTLISGIGLDRAYPGVQRQWAIQTIASAGGQVDVTSAGTLIDLSRKELSDHDWLRLAARIAAISDLTELRLAGNPLTDRALDPIAKWPQLTRLDLTDVPVSPAAVQRLKRQLPQAEVVSSAP